MVLKKDSTVLTKEHPINSGYRSWLAKISFPVINENQSC